MQSTLTIGSREAALLLGGHRVMAQRLVYMDNHATTRVDPRVVESMLPYYDEDYGNAGSASHVFGWNAKDAVEGARSQIAKAIGAQQSEITFTSGATESNNLALRGTTEPGRRKCHHIVSVTTEHKAILEPLNRLSRRGIEVTLVSPQLNGDDAGWLDPQTIADALHDDTLLVSVMLANNEIGVLQPLVEIGQICKSRGVLLHTDATQAVGKVPVDVQRLQVDLMSFSAHKVYGPKGVGALYVRHKNPHVRLTPQIDGGGQEGGQRCGTLNVPGIVGFAKALALCLDEMESETERLRELRWRLYEGLTGKITNVGLNGPALTKPDLRLPGNLNMSFAGVDGEALMLGMSKLAVASGSACTSANPEPSHVLRALGLSDDLARSSLRFGLGRFNTVDDVEFAIDTVAETVARLRKMGQPACG